MKFDDSVHVVINPILHRGQKIFLYILFHIILQFYGRQRQKDNIDVHMTGYHVSFRFLRLARALGEHQEDSPRQGQVREIEKASTARKEGEKKGSS